MQTEADRSAQKCIVASLTKLFPDVTIIGEEGPEDDVEDVCGELMTILTRINLIDLGAF